MRQTLTNLQKLGYIALYMNKDPFNLDNYRPITLLNVDTKIKAYNFALH